MEALNVVMATSWNLTDQNVGNRIPEHGGEKGRTQTDVRREMKRVEEKTLSLLSGACLSFVSRETQPENTLPQSASACDSPPRLLIELQSQM